MTIQIWISIGLMSPEWKLRQNNVVEWCNENCEYFICDNFAMETKFTFTNETDAMAFKLRWSDILCS